MKFHLNFLQILIFISLLANGLCRDYDLVDDSCSMTLDCMQLFQMPQVNVTCLNSKCKCMDINGQQIPCIPSPEVSVALNNIIGGPCPCSQPNTHCDPKKNNGEGVCFCEKDYTPTIDKRRCIKKSLQLNETCDNNSQCIVGQRFSVCDLATKLCVCDKDYVQHNDSCVAIIQLEDTCINDKQCQEKTSNSICVDKKCACAKGFVSNRQQTKCLKNADYNERCEYIDQCKHKLGVGSECYSGSCTCDAKHTLRRDENAQENYCVKKIEFGDYCQEHNDCYQLHLKDMEQTMKCFISECVCRNGYEHKDKHCISSGAISTIMYMNQMTIISLIVILIMANL